MSSPFEDEPDIITSARPGRSRSRSSGGRQAASLGIASLFCGLLSAAIMGVGLYLIFADQASMTPGQRQLQAKIGATVDDSQVYAILQGYILAPIGLLLAICGFFQSGRSHFVTFLGALVNVAILALLLASYQLGR